MKIRFLNSQRGFTLLELMIASALGLVVILAMTSLFKIGMNTTLTITQRADTQQNMRTAIELMSKDLSMAGSGLPSGGLQLVNGAGTTASLFGCDQTSTCYVPNNTYPANGASANYMYPVIPNFGNGVEGGAAIPNIALTNDSITVIYCDSNFPLTNFNFQFNGSQNSMTAQVENPTFQTTNPQPINIMMAGGLAPAGGDLLLLTATNAPSSANGTTTNGQGTSAQQTAVAVGEVTGVTTAPAPTGSPYGSNPTWAISLAANDPLKFNQAGSNGLGSVFAAAGTVTAGQLNQPLQVCRLNVVTYFLQVPPAGGTVQTPRLMRQVSGFQPVPVADNIVNLQFTYDVINTQVNPSQISANQKNPLGSGLSPALIQKINMYVMGQSVTSGGKRSQSMYLTSSVSTPNTSFCNVYSNASTVCQ